MRAERYSDDVETTAYYVVREALANTAKHANATHASVALARSNGHLRIAITDDGRGIGALAPASASSGGLANIRDRVAALRGTVQRVGGPAVGHDRARRPAGGSCRSPSQPTVRRTALDESGTLRVVIAEDNYLVREGLRRLLEDSGEIDVVASIGQRDRAARRGAAARRRTRCSPTSACRRATTWRASRPARDIRAAHPETGVVVLSQHADESYALALFADGSAGLGYLLKDRIGDLEDLVHALREVCAGGSVIDPQIVDTLVRRRSAPGRRARSRRCRRASSRCCARWRRARRTRASSRRCSCRRRPSRST